jgi:hypothetical protein
MKLAIFEAHRESRAFRTEVTSWGFQLKTSARCPGLRSNRTFKSRLLAQAAGERMLKAIAECKQYSMYVHSRKRHHIDNSALSWGYMLTTGPRCGGLLSVGEYRSHEYSEAAAHRMVSALLAPTE